MPPSTQAGRMAISAGCRLRVDPVMAGSPVSQAERPRCTRGGAARSAPQARRRSRCPWLRRAPGRARAIRRGSGRRFEAALLIPVLCRWPHRRWGGRRRPFGHRIVATGQLRVPPLRAHRDCTRVAPGRFGRRYGSRPSVKPRTRHYSTGTIRRTPHWRIAGHEQQRASRARQAATRPEGFERSAPGVVMLGPTRGSPSIRSGPRPRVARGNRARRSSFPAATRRATTRRTSHSRARP
jgi:hypothetical protein